RAVGVGADTQHAVRSGRGRRLRAGAGRPDQRERRQQRREPLRHGIASNRPVLIAPSERPFRNAYRPSMLSVTSLTPPKLGMPLSPRPSSTHLSKSARDIVFRSSTSDGPTRPSWFAP